MRTKWTLMLAVVLLAGPGLALAQTEWNDHQQVVPAPGPGSWDAQRYTTTVLELDGTYHMYPMGREDPSADPLYWYWDIGHATSTDSLSWVMDPANPVLVRGAAGECYNYAVAFATVIHDGAQFRMWYSGGDGEVGWVGHATSPDGSTRTKHPGNPVMGVGAPRAFDDLGVWPGTVLFDGERHRMWYTACNLSAGASGPFFRTDLDLSNADSVAVQYELWWLARGQNNSQPMVSETFSFGAGMSVRYVNVLAEVFGLEPDALGALAIVSSSTRLLAMSRTHNLPGDADSGSHGQSIPAVTAEETIDHGERKRILFATEDAGMRANVGCQNATEGVIPVDLELFVMEGSSLGTERMILLPRDNEQMNRVFEDFAPVSGYVEVWTTAPAGVFYCYGSVLDNVMSDPTTIPPQ